MQLKLTVELRIALARAHSKKSQTVCIKVTFLAQRKNGKANLKHFLCLMPHFDASPLKTRVQYIFLNLWLWQCQYVQTYINTMLTKHTNFQLLFYFAVLELFYLLIYQKGTP